MRWLTKPRLSNRGQNGTKVPKIDLSENYKRYINILDCIFNLTMDFSQLVYNAVLEPVGKKLDTTSITDAYRFLSFGQTAFNTLDGVIEQTVREELRCRQQILEYTKLNHELVYLELTEDQQSVLNRFSKVRHAGHIANARVSREKEIIAGYGSQQKTSQAEQAAMSKLSQLEKGKMELAKIKSSHFKTASQTQQKEHFENKISEYPELSRKYMNLLQSSLTAIQRIKNGEGGHVELASNTKLNNETKE